MSAELAIRRARFPCGVHSLSHGSKLGHLSEDSWEGSCGNHVIAKLAVKTGMKNKMSLLGSSICDVIYLRIAALSGFAILGSSGGPGR